MLLVNQAIFKELLLIYDRPLIEHVVKEAIENCFDVHYEFEHRLVKNGKNKILEDMAKIILDGFN